MLRAACTERLALRAGRACGPQVCFLSAGLRPAGLLVRGDVRFLLPHAFCSFLSLSNSCCGVRVTFVTFSTQTFHAGESSGSSYRNFGARTSLTSLSPSHLGNSEGPLALRRSISTPATLRPEQLRAGRPRLGSVHVKRRRDARRGVRKSLASTRAPRAAEKALCAYIAAQGAVP